MQTKVKAGFKDLKVSAKGEVAINLVVKGDLTDEQILKLHKLKSAGQIFATLATGQLDTDDIHDDETHGEPHEGIHYVKNPDGTVDKLKQATLFEDDEVSDGEPSDDEKEIESMESEVSQEELAAEQAKKDDIVEDLF